MTPEYSNLQLFWYMGGFLLWGIAYGWLVFRIPKHRFVEIPVLAVCGNVTWEFLWGFVWHVEMMGQTLQWFYRLGCLLDVFILVCVFRWGMKQWTLPVFKRFFHPIVVTFLAFWLVFYWTFRNAGFDLPLGSNSAYVINTVMSALYIGLVLRLQDVSAFSWWIGWLKGTGTLMVTVFVFLTYPESRFTQALGITCALLDGTYLLVLRLRQKGHLAPPATAGQPLPSTRAAIARAS